MAEAASSTPALAQQPPASPMQLSPTAPSSHAAAAALPADAMAHSSPPLSSSPSAAERAAMLTSFLALADVQQRYAQPRTVLFAALDEHQHAQELLAKFKAICTPPSIRLPASLALNIVKRCKLVAPPSDPHFFATDVAALQAIEKEATERVYSVLLEAKTKHLKMLHTAAQPSLFTARTLIAHTEFVREYAADTDTLYVPASQSAASSASAFPIDDAVAHFTAHLHSEVAAVTALSVEQRRAAREQQAAAQAAERDAQETVLAGAHTGESIRSIAIKAVRSEMAATASTHSSKAASSSHHSAHRNNENRAVSHAASSSSHSSKKQNAASHAHSSRTLHSKRPAPQDELRVTTDVQGDRRVQQSRSHAGHAANDKHSSSSHPKNAKGGDRSSRPRQSQAAALQGKRKHEGAGGNMSDTANRQHQQHPRRRH